MTSGSLLGWWTSTMMKCWLGTARGLPLSGGGGAGCAGGGGGDGEGGLWCPGAAGLSAGGLFSLVGDWTLGKGPMGCWLSRESWASIWRRGPCRVGEMVA